jgi:hypothetical protein
MAPKALDVKFLCGTQLTFRSLTFATGEDGDLKMLRPGPAPVHLAQDRIPVQEVTSAPPKSFGVSRS